MEIHRFTGLKSFSTSIEITSHPFQTASLNFPRFFRNKNKNNKKSKQAKTSFCNRENTILKWFNSSWTSQWVVPSQLPLLYLLWTLKFLPNSPSPSRMVWLFFVKRRFFFYYYFIFQQELPSLNTVLKSSFVIAGIPVSEIYQEQNICSYVPVYRTSTSIFSHKTSITVKWTTVQKRGREFW